MSHLVLLGDSVFDNAAYVPGQPAVIEQVRASLGKGWQATLLAVDGHVVEDVDRQLQRLPADATHLAISVGGNDALGYSSVLYQDATSVAQVLAELTAIQSEFRRGYRTMVAAARSHRLPLVVCTIYDAIPGLEQEVVTALSIFNDVIVREAAATRVAVLDLRLVCDQPADYSRLSPIEPSSIGGEKIARALARWATMPDCQSETCIVH
jgi:hypothetical protein